MPGFGGTSWDVALDRLEHPAPRQNHWLATVRPDGRPHLMPIIAFWIDGAFHFLAGTGTRKGRDLAADDRCVIPTAGPPPYAFYRLEPTKAFGLPGMFGMFETDDSHKPTRWTFTDE